MNQQKRFLRQINSVSATNPGTKGFLEYFCSGIVASNFGDVVGPVRGILPQF